MVLMAGSTEPVHQVRCPRPWMSRSRRAETADQEGVNPMRRRVMAVVGAALLMATLGVSVAEATASDHSQFVTRQGTRLVLNGKTFRFGGTNNYYLMYSSQLMVNAMLDKAAASDFTVVRAWASFDIGQTDYTGSVDPGAKDKGVYFQYFDPATGRPAYNDGA